VKSQALYLVLHIRKRASLGSRSSASSQVGLGRTCFCSTDKTLRYSIYSTFLRLSFFWGTEGGSSCHISLGWGLLAQGQVRGPMQLGHDHGVTRTVDKHTLIIQGRQRLEGEQKLVRQYNETIRVLMQFTCDQALCYTHIASSTRDE
jgi:hypothetical protein